MESQISLGRVSIIESILVSCKEWKLSKSTWKITSRYINEHDAETPDVKSFTSYSIFRTLSLVLNSRYHLENTCSHHRLKKKWKQINAFGFIGYKKKFIQNPYINTNTQEKRVSVVFTSKEKEHRMKGKCRECSDGNK